MHRALNRGPSKFLHNKWEKEEFENHNKRVKKTREEGRCGVDNSPPPVFKHLGTGYRASSVFDEATKVLAFRSLARQLNMIEHRPQPVLDQTTHDQRMLTNQHACARKRDNRVNAIRTENERVAKKITAAEPAYKVKTWEKDRAKSEKLISFLCELPYVLDQPAPVIQVAEPVPPEPIVKPEINLTELFSDVQNRKKPVPIWQLEQEERKAEKAALPPGVNQPHLPHVSLLSPLQPISRKRPTRTVLGPRGDPLGNSNNTPPTLATVPVTGSSTMHQNNSASNSKHVLPPMADVPAAAAALNTSTSTAPAEHQGDGGLRATSNPAAAAHDTASHQEETSGGTASGSQHRDADAGSVASSTKKSSESRSTTGADPAPVSAATPIVPIAASLTSDDAAAAASPAALSETHTAAISEIPPKSSSEKDGL